MIRKGDVFAWNSQVNVEITRVARDGTWADGRCSGAHGGYWGKRFPLPLGTDYVKVQDGNG